VVFCWVLTFVSGDSENFKYKRAKFFFVIRAKSERHQTTNQQYIFMLYQSIVDKVKTALGDQALTISEVELTADDNFVVELKDAQNKEYTLTFTPDADGNYNCDGVITPVETVTESEEEAKKTPETPACKSEEDEAKTQSKSDEYMAKVAKAMETMADTCSKMDEFMSKKVQAKSETDDVKADSDESIETPTDEEIKATEAKAKTTAKNWWENVKSNY
jgi:hypothetical protein